MVMLDQFAPSQLNVKDMANIGYLAVVRQLNEKSYPVICKLIKVRDFDKNIISSPEPNNDEIYQAVMMLVRKVVQKIKEDYIEFKDCSFYLQWIYVDDKVEVEKW